MGIKKSKKMKLKYFPILLAGSLADVYLHMPRGSNNRLNEASNNRANNNRLFDSQNNNNGGYNVGDKSDQAAENEDGFHKAIYFQSGREGVSQLSVEWWDQHGCGRRDESDPHWIDCQIILQYMCQDGEGSELRNGFSRESPEYRRPENRRNEETFEQKEERKRRDMERRENTGIHEPWEYYDSCYIRNRNRGLFTADQNREGNRGSTRTRQNPNGQRSAYECPEERDYFPYWHPTQWIDITVLTSQTENCPFYREESANRKAKHECVEYYPESESETNRIRKHSSRANNEFDCEGLGGNWTAFHTFLEIVPDVDSEDDCEDWALTSGHVFGASVRWEIPYLDGEGRHQIPTPKCLILPEEISCSEAPWSRANHLGNTDSTDDLANYVWNLPHFHFDQSEHKECILRIRYNISSNDYVESFDPTAHTFYPYPHLTNDPQIELYPKLNLQLAINTAQIARTFEDRTHIFQIHPRPESVPDEAHLVNVGVRGRRGNIQQTFPSLEYDFSPTHLDLREEDFVHIQWEGSNSQPRNQAGEGRDQTDRNNMVSIDAPNWNIPQGEVYPQLETETFTVYYAMGADQSEIVRSVGHIDYHETTVDYRTEKYEILPLKGVTWHDTKYFCEQYGMEMPQPRDEIFNEQLRAFWTRGGDEETEMSWYDWLFGNEAPEGEWRGDIWLGFTDEVTEGEFRDSAGNLVNFTNWNPGQPDDFRGAEDYVGMWPHGTWNDFSAESRTRETFCIRPFRESPPQVAPKSMFEEATWVWSALENDEETNLKNVSENLVVQMASSGYYSCLRETDCNRAVESDQVETLQSQLDNAPASFHGNIVKFNRGEYFFISTRNNNFSNRAQKGRFTVTI